VTTRLLKLRRGSHLSLVEEEKAAGLEVCALFPPQPGTESGCTSIYQDLDVAGKETRLLELAPCQPGDPDQSWPLVQLCHWTIRQPQAMKQFPPLGSPEYHWQG
jgi:hypothetical protein